MSSANFKRSISLFLLIAIGNTMVLTLDTTWWRHTILYEIYISSFKDSNGDGIGDIKGITQKLDHFVDLGIETIHTSPFFKSPLGDFGYDISNFTEIDPLFGTMADFNRLLHEMKRRGLKLIVDFVINHSSDEHPWFQKSVDRIYPYTDFYVWANPKGFDQNGKPIPPNNWWCVFDGSAWEWNDKRGQFYLHQFSTKQPDFNLRSAELIKEIKKILKFWMDRGVDGFRLDATKHFVEDESLRDEPLHPGKPMITTYYDLNHKYTTDLWESYQVIHQLREYTDSYSKTKGHKNEKVLIAEAYTDVNSTMAYYGTKNYSVVHFPYNLYFLWLNNYLNASAYNNMFTKWLVNMPKGATPNWMAENHDNVRIGSRFSEEYIDIVTMTMMTLPGVACIYYGQEIGMMNAKVRPDQRKDPNTNGFGPDSWRDGQRLPMQWDNTTNAGFTSRNKPWLPVNTNYWKVNVEAQRMDKNSRYNKFRELSNIRRTKVMKYGSVETYIVSEWVYAFVRSLPLHKKYVTVLNLGTETENIDLHNSIPHLTTNLEVVVVSTNAGYKKGDKIPSKPQFPQTFTMKPLSALILTEIRQVRPSKSALISESLSEF